MAAEGEKKKEVNPEADAKNWEDRVRTEIEAPKKWVETWGECFENEVPLDQKKRLEYLENQLRTQPPLQHIPKYGVGKPFKDVLLHDYRLKRMKDQGKFDD
mmetsp:Transcript_4631/g.5068  ORF Transcript_4631/g.5068 Transcript_4631/m.5068 type:complete len:101 (-) Transcript_4631:80-382(-)|eukprot:CAMPEP_0173152582 /NCGR_PEP_ID=MMETSP1105-20130129/12328_1 /TAXON_ID=2985 /ORGANISM="Ochromonas sp., Strain BG-1" /LENGTH=100 /DNA_ID=CAMNT_0014068309 /DNA_START=28 /DNA_END=330 /DNA_ORIENTATION=+